MSYSAQALIRSSAIAFMLGGTVAGCSTSPRATSDEHPFEVVPVAVSPATLPTIEASQEQPSFAQIGIASWYRETGKFKRTANGEKPRPMELTAAHRSLPFGTVVRVTSMRTGRSLLVFINDRGPYKRGRIIDLSYGAAKRLGIVDDGVTEVRIAVYDSDQCSRNPTSSLCAAHALASPRPRRASRKPSQREAIQNLSRPQGRFRGTTPTGVSDPS